MWCACWRPGSTMRITARISTSVRQASASGGRQVMRKPAATSKERLGKATSIHSTASSCTSWQRIEDGCDCHKPGRLHANGQRSDLDVQDRDRSLRAVGPLRSHRLDEPFVSEAKHGGATV